jgi:hypothetical protein
MRAWRHCIVITGAFFAASVAHAEECMMAVADGAATVKFPAHTASYKTGLHPVPCVPPVMVISGKACFFIDQIGSERASCVPQLVEDKRVNSSLARRDAGTRQSSGGTALLASLKDEAEGRMRKTQGGKKAQGADALAGFPYGEILAPQGEFLISTKAVNEAPVTAFAIEDKTARKKLSSSLAGNLIRVSGRDIVVGHSYGWTATVGGAARTGSFSVTTLAEEPDLAAELAAAAKSPDVAGNATALAVTRALILYEHQFVFDAIRAMDGAAPR